MGATLMRGRAGESLAAAYLELVGLRVKERNLRVAGVEVDLMAAEGSTSVLVEVKFRGRRDYGGAALAVDHRKGERLRRAARTLAGWGESRVRIDVVTVELDPEGAVVRHYRNAVTD